MKKVLFILLFAVSALFVSSCGAKTQDHSGVHSHEDGTVHQDGDHERETQAKPEQESFDVEADSTEIHSHEDGAHEHDHQH